MNETMKIQGDQLIIIDCMDVKGDNLDCVIRVSPSRTQEVIDYGAFPVRYGTSILFMDLKEFK